MRRRQTGVFPYLSMLPAILRFLGRTRISASISAVMSISCFLVRRWGVATRDMTDDLDGINEQARDISFLITYARSLPNADSSEVAVVNWSWGGIASLFVSARDSR